MKKLFLLLSLFMVAMCVSASMLYSSECNFVSLLDDDEDMTPEEKLQKILAEDPFFEECMNTFRAIKNRWPSEDKEDGTKQSVYGTEVSKELKKELALTFMDTDLCKRVKQQVLLPVGEQPEEGLKKILNRKIETISMEMRVHGEVVQLHLQPDYESDDMILEVSFFQDIYDDSICLISFSVNGLQTFEGDDFNEVLNVDGTLAYGRIMEPVNGVEIDDWMYSNKSISSEKTSDLGRVRR